MNAPEGGPEAPLNREALAREQSEPHETHQRSMPLLVAVLLGAVGAWGATYFWYEAGDGEDAVLGDGRAAYFAEKRAQAQAASGAAPASGPDGAQVFAGICQACHQANGQGIAGAFPPLAGSDWVTGDPRRPAGIVLWGLRGPIEVAGSEYNGVMPAFGEQLDDAEIAAVLTYIRSSWGNDAPPVDAEVVTALRDTGRTEPLQGGEGVDALAATP